MRQLFGGAVAVILLGVHVRLVRLALSIVACVSNPECTVYKAADFNGAMAQALSAIGGLIGALVIAELAVTKPGEGLAARRVSPGRSSLAGKVVNYVAFFYVLIWLGTGLWAFLVTLHHPEALPALTNFGQAWFGLAVAAAYSYFGLKPPSSSGG